MTYEALSNAVRTRVDTEVATGLSVSVIHDNEPTQPPEAGTRWARARVMHTRTELTQLAGLKTYRMFGALELRVFAPLREGAATALEIVRDAGTAFREQTVSSVIYQGATTANRGRTSVIGKGAWWRYDMLTEFWMDDQVTPVAPVTPWAHADVLTGANTIQDRFQTTVGTPESLVVLYDNAPASIPEASPTARWARLTVNHGRNARTQLGPAASMISPGVATAQIFIAEGQGDVAGLQLADVIVGQFRSVVDRGVKFTTPSLVTVGRDGPWWQMNVQLPFVTEEAAA